MSALLVRVANDLATSVEASGIFDWANTQIDAATVMIQAGTFLVTIIVVLIAAAKSRFQLAPTLTAVVVGGLVIWLVCFDGIKWVGERFSDQAEAAGGPAVVSELEPDYRV